LSIKQSAVIKDIFEAILTEHATGLCAKQEMIALKLLELLIACDRLFSFNEHDTGGVPYHPMVERFHELVEREYIANKSVKYYAETLNVHPNYLNFILKKYSGSSAKESINNRIIQESKLMLSYSCLIIKEIAYQLGFDDANYFSTFFQKYTGTSPVLFRQACLNCCRES
jgi:YesN/AraC family two-component response regulator